MKNKDHETISMEEARKETEMASRRIGLLHLAFARTLVDELGEDRGKEMILKAIGYYGQLVGEKAKREVEKQKLEVTPDNFSAGSARDLPRFGMHEGREIVNERGERRFRNRGCVMAKVWREYGEEELGSLYCYVDPAKFMFYNPKYKMVHRKAMPFTGGDVCELVVKETTREEQDAFAAGKVDWTEIDGEIEGRK